MHVIKVNGGATSRMKTTPTTGPTTGPTADSTAASSLSVEVEKTNLEANVSKQSLVQKGFFNDYFLRHFFIDRRKESMPPR